MAAIFQSIEQVIIMMIFYFLPFFYLLFLILFHSFFKFSYLSPVFISNNQKHVFLFQTNILYHLTRLFIFCRKIFFNFIFKVVWKFKNGNTQRWCEKQKLILTFPFNNLEYFCLIICNIIIFWSISISIK